MELTLNPRSWWNVRVRGEWIGPGYVTLGYKLGSAVSIAASYTNYGVRSNHVNDTLRISTISQMFNLNPSIRLLTGKLRHSITVGYSYSSVVDRNVITAQQQQFQGHSLNVAYALQLPNNWIFTTTIFGSKNEAGENPAPSMLNISETIRVAVFKSLELLGSIGYGVQEIASQQSENFFLRFSGHYSLKPFGKLSLLFLLQSTTSERSEVQFLRGSVRYSVNW